MLVVHGPGTISQIVRRSLVHLLLTLAAAATTPHDPVWRIAVDVVTAIGTLGAVIVAVWVAFLERAERKSADQARLKAEEERDALRTDERESQARRIVGWLEDETLDAKSAYVLGGSRTRTVIVVTNGSDLPAFNVSPQAYSPEIATASVAEYIPVLPPGETIRRPLHGVVEAYNERPYAILEFRDAAGRRWQRDEKGGLSLISENDLPPQLRA
ncbi:hypothetical protein [Kribbella sp. NBC_00889]|uniref:hypothetical protein n=1 Tax=Kribbella sp. NBC_00889 TaxID=2975974 RepID=UPI00386E6D78|nr:hypothetical protein OG817_44940 [Kribbella sp. NBC_00889]